MKAQKGKAMETNFYKQNEAVINGRTVAQYLVTCPVGHINFIEYTSHVEECPKRIYADDYEKAERKFNQVCKKILNGTL